MANRVRKYPIYSDTEAQHLPWGECALLRDYPICSDKVKKYFDYRLEHGHYPEPPGFEI
jgi:hypothetical protein